LIGYSEIRRSTHELTEYKLNEKEAEFINILRSFPEDLAKEQLSYMKYKE